MAGALVELPGVTESRLGDSVAAALPDAPAPAPWATRLHAVVWWHRARPQAADHLPEELRSQPRLPVTMAAFVRYDETPVGPYSEVLASPVLLMAGAPSASIPFIAVDSLASILGGRANWALPKTLGAFTWAGARVLGEGEHWSVQASVTARPRGVPFASAMRARQVGPEGELLDTPIRARGRLRPATAVVRTSGPTLPQWLIGGRHPAVVVEGGRFSFRPARPSARRGRR